MTNEEREMLPHGPIAKIERKWTVQERVAGVAGAGISIVTPIILECGPISGFGENDLLLWKDKKGKKWRFGQYKNGAWYKQIA